MWRWECKGVGCKAIHCVPSRTIIRNSHRTKLAAECCICSGTPWASAASRGISWYFVEGRDDVISAAAVPAAPPSLGTSHWRINMVVDPPGPQKPCSSPTPYARALGLGEVGLNCIADKTGHPLKDTTWEG